MKKLTVFIVFVVIVVLAALVFDQKVFTNKKISFPAPVGEKEEEKLVREPVAAGSFYPADPAELSATIDSFFQKAELPPLERHIQGLVVPHAGYVYSGQTAAYGYKALIGQDIERVILIGTSHRESFNGISIYPHGSFETPLGEVGIDEELAGKIINANERIQFRESTHQEEHSLEVQIPFLQKALKNFKIVPVLLGGNDPELVDVLIAALRNLIDDNTLVVASSDLSHYPSDKNARYSDGKVIEAIVAGQREKISEVIAQLEKENITSLETCACGQGAIEVVTELMKGKKAQLLNYASSKDSSGDSSRVVGYATIAFTSDKLEGELGQEEQKVLLEIARNSAETYVREKRKAELPEIESSLLQKPRGAFVTLKKHGQLRGCIGVFEPAEPLYRVVADTAISSATEDKRFEPVTPEELEELEYEISVLSPLRQADSWQNIQVGKHGVKIVSGFRSGVFLPQVATENNWDLEKFMGELCSQKAGLARDCWKDLKTDIYVFTAQVFGEEEFE